MRHGLSLAVSGRKLDKRLELVNKLAGVLRAPAETITSLPPVIRELADLKPDEGDPAWGLWMALKALEMALAWEPAVEGADANPERFRVAARRLAHKALTVQRHGRWNGALSEALDVLAKLDAFDDVSRATDALKRVPLGLPVTDLFAKPRPWSRPSTAAVPEPESTVHLRFDLDGEPVSWPMAIQTGRAYRLRAFALADRWPSSEMTIELEGVSKTVIEREVIKVRRATGAGECWIVPRADISPNDSIDLTPVAVFANGSRVQVVGQRVLRVTTFDPATLGSGQPMVGQRIIELIGELDARIKNLPPQDRRDLIHLLDATTRFAALANEHRDLRGLDESAFQAKLKQALVQDRLIGTRLQEAPKLGGGTTDLLFGRLVDELKVNHTPIDIDDADRFVRQPTHYASAGDCPISMLTILDDSPKSDPPGVASNYMRWAYPRITGTSNPTVPSMVAVVLIPIGFPVPSEWSKRKRGAVDHEPGG